QVESRASWVAIYVAVPLYLEKSTKRPGVSGYDCPPAECECGLETQRQLRQDRLGLRVDAPAGGRSCVATRALASRIGSPRLLLSACAAWQVFRLQIWPEVGNRGTGQGTR